MAKDDRNDEQEIRTIVKNLFNTVRGEPSLVPQVLGSFLYKPTHLSQLRQAYGDDLVGVLSVLVANPAGAGYLLGPTGICVQIPVEIKIMSECRRGVNLLIESLINPERIRPKSLAFYDLFRHDRGARSTVARTIRMLMYFEALFCNDFVGKLFGHEIGHDIAWWKTHLGDNPWAHYYFEADRLMSSKGLPRVADKNVLRAAIDDVLAATVPLEASDSNWAASLALLMLVAVAYSQLDHYLGNGWEYYSAGHARADLSSRVPFNHEPTLLDIIAILIYYQSAAGQCARQTGSSSFVEAAALFAENHRIGKELLVKSIRLIGVIEEARNHFVPETNDVDQISYLSFPINHDLDRRWDSTDYSFSKESDDKIKVFHCRDVVQEFVPRTAETAVEHILTSTTREGATWAFTPKYIPDPSMAAFRRLVESKARPPGNQTISLYSFGRQQSRKLQAALKHAIEQVTSTPESFGQWFDLRSVVLPSVLDPEQEELLIEVWLNDTIAAKAQLGLKWP